MSPIFAEVMDKMPSLESEWFSASITGAVAFVFARYLPLGWLVGGLIVYFQYNTEWFVGDVARYAMMEDPRTTRIAQSALLVPVFATGLGCYLRYLWWARRESGKAAT